MWIHPDGTPSTLWEMSESVVANVPTWADLEWIAELWPGPIILKGLMTATDARRAVDAGAAGIVVSNHGGRSLDGLPSTLSVLPEVVEAVGDQIEVYVDGGIRRGSDIAKALALGARACLLGRAMTFAHAAAGEAGARQMLEILHHGLDSTLGSLGCASVDELDPSFLTGNDLVLGGSKEP
jgi:isopentenyl diphosphate isomerase/L-lactate dehydrogenase-like FMN-dependent dehydrogenase